MDFSWAAVVAIIKDVWWFLSVPLVAVVGIGMLYLRTQFPTKAQYEADNKAIEASIAALSGSIATSERDMDKRITKMEADLRQLPGRVEVQALGERIGRVEKEVATSIEALRGVEKTVGKIDHTLTLILDHMLKGQAQ